jgi:acyl-CoA synthetase (AMP-forming)/AMP-acid ligase II
VAERLVESWRDVLRTRRALDKPWLILPTSPHTSNEHRAISFAALHDHAERVASRLRSIAAPGTRVVIVADNSPECCLCVLGVLLSGMTLVPIAPPSLGRPGASWRGELDRRLRECSPALLLCREAELGALECQAHFAVGFEALLGAEGGVAELPAGGVDAGQTALWQYTSGTTGRPSAVELSHNNLLQNIASIGLAVDASDRDVGASWLPIFHDMGLIGSLLFTTYWGMSLVLMAPRTFVSRPESWITGQQAAVPSVRHCGSVPYSAPEQLASDGSVDHRADVYSLGMLARDLLGGDFVQRHAELARVLRRATHASPAKRLQSVQELRTGLEEGLRAWPDDGVKYGASA